jgi:hypothetical protein
VTEVFAVIVKQYYGMISCICYKVDEICAILVTYAVSSVDSLIGFPETSVKMQLYAA